MSSAHRTPPVLTEHLVDVIDGVFGGSTGCSVGGPMLAPWSAKTGRATLHMINQAVDIAEKLSLFSDPWSPKVVALLNDYEIKVVKLRGEFVWHSHEHTDELFLVVDGELTNQLRDGDVVLRPGQLFVVPKGVEHCPTAAGEVHALLIEPVGVVNTGGAGGTLTAVYDDSLI